jgi:flavin reductase (DIM6/NTAB) family NADH-FMN oxidoreductase RutF
MARRKLALSKVYGLIEPGPVVLLATSQRGRHNVMPMSWHTMMEFEPPWVGCVVSARNFSFAALRATRQCTLNIAGAEMARTVVGCGNTSGRRTDKFNAFGLTPLVASQVEAPLVAQCHANLECRVADTRMVNRYNFFVLEVVAAWLDPSRKDARTLHHRGWGAFMVAGDTIRLRSGKR